MSALCPFCGLCFADNLFRLFPDMFHNCLSTFLSFLSLSLFSFFLAYNWLTVVQLLCLPVFFAGTPIGSVGAIVLCQHQTLPSSFPYSETDVRMRLPLPAPSPLVHPLLWPQQSRSISSTHTFLLRLSCQHRLLLVSLCVCSRHFNCFPSVSDLLCLRCCSVQSLSNQINTWLAFFLRQFIKQLIVIFHPLNHSPSLLLFPRLSLSPLLPFLSNAIEHKLVFG